MPPLLLLLLLIIITTAVAIKRILNVRVLQHLLVHSNFSCTIHKISKFLIAGDYIIVQNSLKLFHMHLYSPVSRCFLPNASQKWTHCTGCIYTCQRSNNNTSQTTAKCSRDALDNKITFLNTVHAYICFLFYFYYCDQITIFFVVVVSTRYAGNHIHQ